MKKILLLSILICALHSHAQENNYGVKIGINANGVINDSQNSGDITAPKGVGFIISGFYDFKINESFGLIGNLNFNKRITNYEPPKANLSYFELNPMLKFDLNNDYGTGFYLKAGVNYSFLLSAKENDTNQNIKEDFNSSLLGFNFGFGSDISNLLGIEFIMGYSFSNSLKEFENQKIKSNFLSGNISLVLNLNELIK